VRVVLVDARLDLAHEVRADVRGLGVDAAGDAREERDARRAETEGREDLERLLLRVVDGDDEEGAGDADEAEADDDEAHDRAGLERDREAVVERARAADLARLLVDDLPARAGRRRARVAVGGDHHAAPARRRREDGAEEEREHRADAVGLGRLVLDREEHEEDEAQEEDELGEGLVLLVEEGLGALLDHRAVLVDDGPADARARGEREQRRVEVDREEEGEDASAERREHGLDDFDVIAEQVVGHGDYFGLAQAVLSLSTSRIARS